MDSKQQLRDRVAHCPPRCQACIYTKTRSARSCMSGKAKNLRSRVRSYFNEDRLADQKTGTLISEAHDVDFIQVDNNKEALALENNLIKQYKPRFNNLPRDDKTYPYIKLTGERFPRVLCDTASAQGRQHVLWTVFSRQSRRTASFTSFTVILWFHRATSISTARTGIPVCSTTSRGASGRACRGW